MKVLESLNRYLVRLLMTALTAVVGVKYLASLSFQGDTAELLREVDRMLAMLRRDEWTGWQGGFPLLQKLPVLLLKWQGLSNESCMTALTTINLAAFAGILWKGYASLSQHSRRVAMLFVAIMLSGPFLWYARTSFGEVLSSFCILGFVVSCRRAEPSWKLFLWLLVAGISKETLPPFLFVLGLLSTSVQRSPGGLLQLKLSRVWTIGAATLASLATNVAFNLLRFKSPLNAFYLNPVFMVPSWTIQANYFMALWISPNGGISFYWPSLILWLGLGTVTAVRQHFLGGRRTSLVPIATILLVLGGTTLGLSKWFAPLGWVCWGPRLLLPQLPAVAYLVGSYYGPELQHWLSITVLTRKRAWLTGTLLGILSLPQFGVLFRPGVNDSFFGTDLHCSRVAVIEQDANYYYYCMRYGLWTKNYVLLKFYSQAPLGKEYLFTILCVVLWSYLFVMAARATTSWVQTQRDV